MEPIIWHICPEDSSVFNQEKCSLNYPIIHCVGPVDIELTKWSTAVWLKFYEIQ